MFSIENLQSMVWEKVTRDKFFDQDMVAAFQTENQACTNYILQRHLLLGVEISESVLDVEIIEWNQRLMEEHLVL